MPDYSDAYLKDILTRTKRIAVVGVSPNPVRPSNYVARYLSLKGFRGPSPPPATRHGCLLLRGHGRGCV